MDSLLKIAVACAFITGVPAWAETMYVAGEDGTIVRVADDAVTVFASGLDHPRGMAEDRAGNLYVAVIGANTIVEFPRVNGVLSPKPIVFASNLHAPMDLTFDTQGNLYEADQDGGVINKFPYSGEQLLGIPTAVITDLTDNDRPCGLRFDAQGNLYVAVYIGGILRFANTDGLSRTPTIFSNISRARQMAFDREGNLFTADHVQQRVYKFPNTASGLSSKPEIWAERHGLDYPHGVAFDSSGNLYIANWGGGSGDDVLQFAASGGVLSNTPTPFVSGFGAPTYILVYAAPGGVR